MTGKTQLLKGRRKQMSKWHGGKGSKPRPIKDMKKFDSEWDRIFNKEKKDLNYESDNPLERPFEPSPPSAVDDAADVMCKYTNDGNSAEHFGKYAHPAYTRYPHLKKIIKE